MRWCFINVYSQSRIVTKRGLEAEAVSTKNVMMFYICNHILYSGVNCAVTDNLILSIHQYYQIITLANPSTKQNTQYEASSLSELVLFLSTTLSQSEASIQVTWSLSLSTTLLTTDKVLSSLRADLMGSCCSITIRKNKVSNEVTQDTLVDSRQGPIFLRRIE